MKMSEAMMEHVKNEVERLEYGRVVIEVVNGRTTDVTTERRVRFQEDRPSVQRRG